MNFDKADSTYIDDDTKTKVRSNSSNNGSEEIDEKWLEFMIIHVGSVVFAFNAGFINGITYQSLGRGKFVSHITGVTTTAGVDAASHNYTDMGINLTIVVSFCLGAGISGGLLSPSSLFTLGQEYGPLLIIGGLLFFISSMLLFFLPSSHSGYYFAAMACGIQNTLTTYPGHIMRTTHMTGTITDIGIVLGKYLVKGDVLELWKLKILIPLFISFLLGGFVSKYVYVTIGDLAICLSSSFFLIVGSIYTISTNCQWGKRYEQIQEVEKIANLV